jgi:GAF domain-containing protein
VIAAEPPVYAEPPAWQPQRQGDLLAAAALCSQFARVRDWQDVDDLVAAAARLLDAVGLVVWSQAGRGDTLVAVLAHGYPPEVVARMPVVPHTADNAIAAAFRSGQRSMVSSDDGRPGALVVPLVAAAGCVGVLALELAGGAERSERVGAFADIVAAQLAPLLGATVAAEAVSA